jgi:hypothetical protein
MIETAIRRFGGMELWRKLDYVLLEVESLSGAIPRWKGIGRSFPHIGRVQVFPKGFRALFFGVGGALLGEFASGSVREEGGILIADHRPSFAGLAKYRSWDLKDAIYFFGYALTTYLSVPFILPDLPTRTRPWRDGFCVEAKFPPEIHTHCRNQQFYCDKEGLLMRHDYVAEVIGPFAYGAHFTSDYEDVDGLPVARSRRVLARIGRWVTPIPVLSAHLKPLQVGYRPPPEPSVTQH